VVRGFSAIADESLPPAEQFTVQEIGFEVTAPAAGNPVQDGCAACSPSAEMRNATESATVAKHAPRTDHKDAVIAPPQREMVND
jgi:hypothetical protein